MKWFKRFFCNHEFEHVRNIHGDEINWCGGHRSIWRCKKCGCTEWRDYLQIVPNMEDVSDGDHTFRELYWQRAILCAAFFNTMNPIFSPHKAHKHYNSNMEVELCFGGGYFIVMATLPTGQISCHFENKYWNLFNIPEKDCCDIWDGHTSDESFGRIMDYIHIKQKRE